MKTRNIFIILALAALASIAACAGIIKIGSTQYFELKEAQSAAETFLDKVAEGRLEAAYTDTSPGFRDKVDIERFRSLVEQTPDLAKASPRSVVGTRIYRRPEGPQAIVRVDIRRSAKRNLSVVVALVKVDGKWQVDSINMP